jgi:hypothetical protein
MSDGVFTIATPHPDVAELAQGFIERVDGEHLLLPLPEPLDAGTPLQFMVVLVDGTAAFMGAGVCADVTDQGDAAPAEHRFETLLGGLQFDERSQPVYDYIVAIRSQAIAIQEQQGASTGDADDEPTEFIDSAAMLADAQAAQAADVEFDAADSAPPESERPAAYAAPVAYASEAPSAPSAQFRTAPPVAVPTGVLRRPAIGVHWQPASPRRPQPALASGLFRYNGAGLPAPAAPAIPELPRNQWVQPAPRPGEADAAAAAGATRSSQRPPSARPPSMRAPAEVEIETAVTAERDAPVEVQEENPWEA